MKMQRVLRRVLSVTIFTLLFSHLGGALATDTHNPLEPADTSSPRATFIGFIATLNQANARLAEVVKSYRKSSRLYFSDAERAEIERVRDQVDLARRTLNLSELPVALTRTDSVSRNRIMQLKEVLDRLEPPKLDSIPDNVEMESRQFKRWTVPGTEITIARVEQGPRAGEYLFSPETVERLPEFYRKIKHLPYRSHGTDGWYKRYRYGGAGLREIIPLKWMRAMPDWARILILDQPLWRWFGLVVVLLAASGIFFFVRRVATAWARRDSDSGLRLQWARLVSAVTLLILLPIAVYVFSINLRISGYILEISTLSLWAIFTLTLTWAVWLSSHVLAESIVTSQQMLVGSIDSQLIRLGLRLVATILSITILVVGAQQLGIPAYSVIAGLGIGGIAVALAAKDSLANLIGSLLIMFEKPFRVGHWIKVDNTEGFVESIGFRSTRIRTFHNSLVSIPSNHLVNSTVDNMAMRKRNAVRTFLHISYDTPADKVEKFVAAIHEVIENHPDTYKKWFRVRFDDFGEYGLAVLVNFLLEGSEHEGEQGERQRILLDILKLAEAMDIQFAIPPLLPFVGSMSDQDSRSLPQSG